jgi:hypothetical protein
VLKPLSLGLVRRTRTTRTAIQKGQPRLLSLGCRRFSDLENAVDGVKCDGELTVMEQPEAPSSTRPIEVYRHPEHQVLGCRQIDHRSHSRQSMLFKNRPITGIWAQHRDETRIRHGSEGFRTGQMVPGFSVDSFAVNAVYLYRGLAIASPIPFSLPQCSLLVLCCPQGRFTLMCCTSRNTQRLSEGFPI